MGRATDSILIPAVGEPTALRRCKIRDVVGLYLHPPQKAVVICVDEMGPQACRSYPGRRPVRAS